MRMSIKTNFILLKMICCFLGSLQSHFLFATELYEMNPSVRALGMGNAYVGVVQDADALFYNPAGLSRVSGINWLVIDPKIGLDGTQVFQTIQDLQGSTSFDQTVRNLYGDHVWIGGGVKSAFTVPHLGMAIYDHLDASMAVNNPVYPNLDASVVNDYGYALGASLPILPVWHMGAVVKYVQRTGARTPFGPSYISTLSTSGIESQIQNKGVGYSLDLGTNFLIPGPVSPVFSFVWKDIGTTVFRPEDPLATAPPQQQDEMIVGLALNVQTPVVNVSPAFDFKYLNRADVQLGKKIHFGVELGLPMIDIRAGFSEGYYTLGAGFHLGLVRVEAATYGVELGAYPGQKEDRRYLVQAAFELGFSSLVDLLSGGGSSSHGKGGGSGRGGSGGSSRHLKQRR